MVLDFVSGFFVPIRTPKHRSSGIDTFVDHDGGLGDSSPSLAEHLTRLREISSAGESKSVELEVNFICIEIDMLIRMSLWAVVCAELYMPPIASFIISCKWTTFDIGVTMWMQEEFDYTIGQVRYSVHSGIPSPFLSCLNVRKRPHAGTT